MPEIMEMGGRDPEFEQMRKEEQSAKDMEIEVEGIKMKVGDIFPEGFKARELANQIGLVKKAIAGKLGTGDSDPLDELLEPPAEGDK